MINNKVLFLNGLRKVEEIGIITVSGDNYHSTYIGTVVISIKDSNNKIHRIAIPNALHFLLSPVNVVSIGQLSLHFGDRISVGDKSTCIGTTYGRSYFL